MHVKTLILISIEEKYKDLKFYIVLNFINADRHTSQKHEKTISNVQRQ